jgi:prevent-host-death family protein
MVFFGIIDLIKPFGQELEMIVNLSEAKAKLSKLVDMAYHGEEIIIAKNNLPLVRLVAHNPKTKRRLGLLQGKIRIPDDFIEEDEEINAMFYGEKQ